MPKKHTIKAGESLFTVAHQYGFPSWLAIWDHADNADLKDKRKDAHTLAPGDVVSIPDKTPKEWKVRTDEKHVFRLRNALPVLIKILLTDDEGQPEAGKKFKAEVEGLPPTEGTTKPDGTVEFEAKPDSKEATLTVWSTADESNTFTVEIGHLDPVTEVAGVQARLHNLGYDCPVSGSLDAKTRQAIRDFQESLGGTATGELNDTVRNDLVKAHGR